MNITINKDHLVYSNQDGEYHITPELLLEKGLGLEHFILGEIAKKKNSEYQNKAINFEQASDLGFCKYGIEDFCNKLDLDINKTYKIKDLNKKLTIEVLQRYPDECIKLFKKDTLKYLGGVKGVLNKDTVDLVLREEYINSKILHQLSCDFALSVLSNFEKEYPEDKRPRLAIEAKLKWIEGKISDEELVEAGNAAWTTANTAVSSASHSAARSASRSATESAGWSATESAGWSAESEWSAESAERNKQVEMIKRRI